MARVSCGRGDVCLLPPRPVQDHLGMLESKAVESEAAIKMFAPPAAMGGNNLGKRKRGEESEVAFDGEKLMNSAEKTSTEKIEMEAADAAADNDPLFATEKTRQRPAKKPKKVNGIVKKIVTKDFTAELADYEATLAKDPEGLARRYQLEVLAEAKKRNTIVYLETGCGKTLIAVLLMKSLAHKLRIPTDKKVAVFLAPTVSLVRQQAGVISMHTDLKVGDYYGSLGVDTWKPEKWQGEVNNHEVLVMTPQILVDLLNHAIIKFDVVELLIFDECHHANKKHGYCKIMDRYRDVPEITRPKVFGMTASPVIRKGVTSGEDCQRQIAKLERNLDARVCTVKDRSELESFVPTPLTQGVEYDSPFMDIEEYRVKLQACAEKHRKFVHEKPEDSDEQFKDYAELTKKLEKSIHRYHNALVYCVQDLGLWCAYKAAALLLKNDIKDIFAEPDMDVVAVLKVAKDRFLKEAVELFNSPLPEAPCSEEQELAEAVKAGQLTPKVKKLVEVLLNYRDANDMRCIVFVERVAAAVALSALLSGIKLLSFLRCEYLAGVNGALDPATRTYQDQVLLKFRTGQVNVLIATNVAEEGLDIQACHSVIRFDGCKTVRSYIQSRGRARRPGSDYIVFMEMGNEKQKEDLNDLIKSEMKMMESAQDRTVVAPILPPEVENVEIYRVDSTGASLSTLSSVAFIYRYCSRLPGDKYYTPRPEFLISDEEAKLHICTIRLPPNAVVREVVGPKRNSRILAKQVACLDACKLLHSMGAINDHLLPITDDGDIDDDEDKINLKALKRRGTGTTKQKELHCTKAATKLRGSWGSAERGQMFHAYNLSFSPDERDTHLYASFTFLVEAKLDDDVARLEVDLAMKGGMMGRAKFFPAGEVSLSPEEIKDCKDCQEIFFNAMFSKLLTRTGRSLGPEKGGGPETLTSFKSLVIANEEDRSRVWNENKMYLLLPNCPQKDTKPAVEQAPIDWQGVKKTATAARRFRSLYVPPPTVEKPSENSPPAFSSEVSSEDLRMGFGTTLEMSSVVNAVVLTVHTGLIYCITKVLHDKTAESPFPTEDEEEKKFETYSDYFQQTHKRTLKYPKQPMLQAKQTYNPRNLLARNSMSGLSKSKKKKVRSAQESESGVVQLPPELCIILGISDTVLRTTYLLPSVMHRLDAALAASQLRDSIAREFPQPVIPVMRIVESLTTLRCLEEFSLEGLELLGDSFLKYAWSKRLFLSYSEKHEGQLSGRRAREICNAKLHELAFQRDLPEFIRDEVFDPSRWVPPGMQPPKSLVCRCNEANLYRNQREKTLAEGDEKPKKKDKKVFKIGKSCGNGHRWICSKTISDVVEALIGAYLVDSDDDGALNFMTWVGMEVKVDPLLVEKARTYMACDSTVNVGADLQALESRLNYTFKNKALLVEAITHASHHELGGGFCYQRLEFLGDAALDYLITKHLYFSHPGLTPGRLTDLRSAAVNNDCFARIAVKHGLNKYLRHGSGFLLKQIEEYIRSSRELGENKKETSHGWDGVKGPKVLGDLVESIAGAVLVDSGFDLETVWKIMKPLLSPIVTPETLTLHPVRRLQELCHSHDYKVIFRLEAVDQLTRFTIEVNVGDEPLSVTSCELQKKNAQKIAAERMLALLKLKYETLSQTACNTTVLESMATKGPEVLEKQQIVPPKRKFGELYEGEDSGEKRTKHSYSVNMSCGSAHLSADEHRKEMETEGQSVVVPA
ncbi:hypothetical protein R1sor_002835 [Riccia sorocarpa]|uniref:Uncharacterized protein n=1 Tax=Riccia sorocarpa TaxID=122646 RepID=A0ABD3GZW0_9MARC